LVIIKQTGTNRKETTIRYKNKRDKMSPKEKKKEMHKLVTMSYLYIECLDNLKATNPKVIEFKNNIIGFLEILGDKIADTDTVQKTVYFQDISYKIDTVLRHSFKDN